MKKKGFTLVELLAVIAILAILVIIALPNVMGMFNSAKRNTFITEIKKIYRGAEQAYVKDSFDTSGSKVYSKIKSGCTNELDMSMRDDLDYYIRINSQGKVDKFYARDGSYQFEYEGDMTINDLDDVEELSTAMERVEISCGGAETVIDSSLTMFKPGEELNKIMKRLSGQSNPTVETVNTTITAFKRSETLPNVSYENVSDNGKDIYIWYDSGTIYYYSEDDIVALNNDSSQMFRLMTKLTDISGLSEVDASHVRKLISFFAACPSLTSIEPLRNWDTRRIENLNTAFAGGKCNNDYCPNNIASLEPLKNWNTKSVTSMSGTFQLNISIESLDGLQNWDTSHVTNMQATFLGYTDIPNHINSVKPLSKWNTSKVTNMRGMFQNNIDLESLEGLENWDTSNVTTMRSMFMGSPYSMHIKSVKPLSKWNTSKVTDMHAMFQLNVDLESLKDLESWDTSKVTDMAYLFNGENSLTSLTGLEKWNTSKVVNMAKLFMNCNYLEDASAIKNWDVSNVEDMSYMFHINSSAIGRIYSELSELDLSKWNMAKVKNYDYFIESHYDVNSEFTIRNKDVSSYNHMLYQSAFKTHGGSIIVNYTSETEELVDNMILTKSNNGKVEKGRLVN